jgi:hypothetical protein
MTSDGKGLSYLFGVHQSISWLHWQSPKKSFYLRAYLHSKQGIARWTFEPWSEQKWLIAYGR